MKHGRVVESKWSIDYSRVIITRLQSLMTRLEKLLNVVIVNED